MCRTEKNMHQDLVLPLLLRTFFLFCDVNAHYWIDTAPVHVNTLGNWTRKLLVRMGSAPRGFSAHRSGFVARACIHAIMRAKGVQLNLNIALNLPSCY